MFFVFSCIRMEEVIRPVQIISTIVGLEPATYRLHIFQTFFILMVLTAAVIARQFFESVAKSPGLIVAFVEFGSFNFQMPTLYCCIIMTLAKSRKVKEFLDSVKLLDKKLSSLDFARGYKSSQKLTQKLIILVILKTILQQIPFCVKGLWWDKIDAFDFIVYNVPLIVIDILLLRWITYLRIIYNHFKTLNTILKTFQYGQFSMVEEIRQHKKILGVDTIRTCGSLYDALRSQSVKLNSAFSWQILFLVPTTFILSLFYFFETCRMIKKLTQFDCQWPIYGVLHFSIFFELVLPCIAIREESEKFANILHKIHGNDVDEAVNILILQSHHQKIEFSACGVLPLDATLIYTVIGALATYLIILLQFDL